MHILNRVFIGFPFRVLIWILFELTCRRDELRGVHWRTRASWARPLPARVSPRTTARQGNHKYCQKNLLSCIIYEIIMNMLCLILLGMGFVYRMVNACRSDVCRSSASLDRENILGMSFLSHVWLLTWNLLSHIRTGTLCLDLRVLYDFLLKS